MDFRETDLVSLYLSEMQILKNIQTDKQAVQLYLHPLLGKVLIIDGEIQHIENYQCIYHEMLVHLPISFLSNPKSALIIGGGSLFAAHEILKYSTITKVDLCDYDPCVISLMKNHYSHAKNVLYDSRFHYINKNAIEFIEVTPSRYDLIVNDSFNIVKETNQSGIPLSDCLFEMLTESGVCSDIIYRHIFDKDTSATIRKMETYPNTCFSLVTVPEYPGVLHLEAIWGKNQNLTQNARTSYNLEQSNMKMFEYFNPYMLPYYLYLPPYIKHLFTE